MKKHELMAIAIKLGLVKSEQIVKPKIVKPKIVKQTVKQNVVVEKKVNNDDDDYDKVSAKLQQLIFITPNDKIKQALIKQNFKGRMNTNKIMLNMQLLQTFNTVQKIKDLINAIKQ